jgi:hypothetical protein
MFEAGMFVALGLLAIFAKCSWRIRMWILSHPLFIDISVFILLTLLHWGTFSGVMAATIGALMCSMVLAFGKFIFGCYLNNKYQPGIMNVEPLIEREKINASRTT